MKVTLWGGPLDGARRDIPDDYADGREFTLPYLAAPDDLTRPSEFGTIAPITAATYRLPRHGPSTTARFVR